MDINLSDTTYEVGTLKLTWINKKDYSLLDSKMFPQGSLQEVLKHAETNDLKDFMLFELVSNQRNNEFEWRLLPYGSANKFLFHMKAQDSLIAWSIFALIIGFSIYGMAKAYKLTR
jgi:hypothetical protein